MHCTKREAFDLNTNGHTAFISLDKEFLCRSGHNNGETHTVMKL